MNLKNKKAFTLIELLVVITILAVLAAVAVPQVIGIVNTARNTSIRADMGQIPLIATRVEMERGVFNTISCNAGNDPRIEEICSLIAQNVPDGRGGIHSNSGATTYCVESQLHRIGADPLQFWCVDHTGVQRMNTLTRVCNTIGSITRVTRTITITGVATAASTAPHNVVIPRFTTTGGSPLTHTIAVPGGVVIGDTNIVVAGKIAAAIRASVPASVDWDVVASGGNVVLTARRYGNWGITAITVPTATGITYGGIAAITAPTDGLRSRCFLY